MNRRGRSLRRARAWRWEPPDAGATAEAIVATEHAQQRWDEARAKAIAWAVAASGDPGVVYLDTETTGFGPRAEIVDVAVVAADGDVLFDSLVRPTRRIPADVIAIHGITDAHVKDAPAWSDLYEDLRHILDGHRVVVYNVVFDKQMITQSCARHALPLPAVEWECAMKKYAGYYGSWDRTKRWFRFQKLERAVLAFGAEPGGHRAAADALACRAVVHGMAATPPPMDLAGTLHLAALPVDRGNPRPLEPAPLATTSPRPNPPSDPLARWARAAHAFVLLLERLPAELTERPGACGTWSPREVAAHCAGWEWEAARRVRLTAHNPDLPDAVYDVDGFNAASVAVRFRMSWTATLDDLAKANAALAAAAATNDQSHAREWLTGRAADFEEHTVALQRWLDGGALSAMPAAQQPGKTAPARLEIGDSLA